MNAAAYLVGAKYTSLVRYSSNLSPRSDANGLSLTWAISRYILVSQRIIAAAQGFRGSRGSPLRL
jgi:hypothetical protein